MDRSKCIMTSTICIVALRGIKIIGLIDSECVYIKNLILRRIGKTKGISDATKAYITTKCENDPCYVVRMVCAEEIEANNLVSGTQ